MINKHMLCQPGQQVIPKEKARGQAKSRWRVTRCPELCDLCILCSCTNQKAMRWLQVLRETLNCTLPIEVIYSNPSEMSKHTAAKFEVCKIKPLKRR